MKTNRFSKSLALATPLVGGMIAEAEAAAYIKIGDIKGESQAVGFEDYVKISYFKIEIVGGAERADSVEFKNPQLRFPVEQASPELMLACAQGKILPEATLVLTRTLGDGQEVAYYKVTFSNVSVSSYSTSGAVGGDALPTEEITLGYTEVEWTYVKFDQGGKVLNRTTTGVLKVIPPKE